jgi:hypothetical protein
MISTSSSSGQPTRIIERSAPGWRGQGQEDDCDSADHGATNAVHVREASSVHESGSGRKPLADKTPPSHGTHRAKEPVYCRPYGALQHRPHFLMCRYLSPCKTVYTGFPHSGHRGSVSPLRLYARLTCEAIFHRSGTRENMTAGKAASAGRYDHHRHGAADKGLRRMSGPHKKGACCSPLDRGLPEAWQSAGPRQPI